MLITVDEIFGDFTHSYRCLDTELMDQNPRIGLHPAICNHALQLLHDRVPLLQVCDLSHRYAIKQFGETPGDHQYQYILNLKESTSLYRTLAREQGIRQWTLAEDNLDAWFGLQGKPPNPHLSASCLSYVPYTEETGHLSLIYSTPEQRLLAWQYAHKQQAIMDLTFGLCSSHVLTAILMAIDDHYIGIPIAQFHFTAKKEAKAVHADYNKEIIEDLLKRYKFAMGKNTDGEEFLLEVAIWTGYELARNYSLAVYVSYVAVLAQRIEKTSLYYSSWTFSQRNLDASRAFSHETTPWNQLLWWSTHFIQSTTQNFQSFTWLWYWNKAKTRSGQLGVSGIFQVIHQQRRFLGFLVSCRGKACCPMNGCPSLMSCSNI